MLSHHMTMQNFPSKNMSSHVEMQVNKERAGYFHLNKNERTGKTLGSSLP